jgi:hypothetical protein
MRTEGEAPDRITEAGAVIASWTRLWSQLLVRHVAGPDGRCRGCPSSVHVSPRSPCRLAELAMAAQAAHRMLPAPRIPTSVKPPSGPLVP